MFQILLLNIVIHIVLIFYSILYDKGVTHTDVLYSLLKAEEYRNLVDFDNHLDDISLDWQNRKLNKTIEEFMEKYK